MAAGPAGLASRGQAARCRLNEQQLAGERSRLIYRLHCYRCRKGETKAFTWTEYRDLLIAAHRQLPGGAIALVCDNLSVHLRAELRAFTDAQAWLRVFRLPGVCA